MEQAQKLPNQASGIDVAKRRIALIPLPARALVVEPEDAEAPDGSTPETTPVRDPERFARLLQASVELPRG